MGVLRIHGTIELGQFWPQRSSDADTSKIKVSVGEGSFAYSATGKTFKGTRVFEDASVRGAAAGPVIEKGRITVRLQGIDAPELHYRAAPLKSNRPEITPAGAGVPGEVLHASGRQRPRSRGVLASASSQEHSLFWLRGWR